MGPSDLSGNVKGSTKVGMSVSVKHRLELSAGLASRQFDSIGSAQFPLLSLGCLSLPKQHIMALFVQVDKDGMAWTTVLVACASRKLSMLAPSSVP